MYIILIVAIHSSCWFDCLVCCCCRSAGLLCSGLRLANNEDSLFVDDAGVSVVLLLLLLIVTALAAGDGCSSSSCDSPGIRPLSDCCCSSSDTGFASSTDGSSVGLTIDFFFGNRWCFLLPAAGGASVCCFGANAACFSGTRNLDLFLSLDSDESAAAAAAAGGGVALAVSCCCSCCVWEKKNNNTWRINLSTFFAYKERFSWDCVWDFFMRHVGKHETVQRSAERGRYRKRPNND